MNATWGGIFLLKMLQNVPVHDEVERVTLATYDLIALPKIVVTVAVLKSLNLVVCDWLIENSLSTLSGGG